MKIHEITNYHQIQENEETILVLGYFDGLHLGHKALFDVAKTVAKDKGLKVVVLTFPESPQLAFAKFHPDLLRHISYPTKRYAKFAEYGVDDLYLLPFTSDFASLKAKDFMATYLKALNPHTIVVGFDYKFGCDGQMASYLASQSQCQVIEVPEVQDSDQKISSTRIRQLLAQGQIQQVNRLLGYDYSIRGLVVHGDARGRTIGFPTANIALLDQVHLPSDGVYVTEVRVKNQVYRAMTSIGKNVTFGGNDLRIESHLFDFTGEIYGETIEIFWLDKIREMEKFSGIEELICQLEADQKIAKNWKKLAI
ncbi:bifunctional riboflavin kinase/FAD synthetase [Streptococcus sp. sy010]|uniref:bifunctional riboflavin kinase/FAD synthetase n=1 Tax=Streptococcus sp. sy010 TaxID=2600148 RepID=UPI0011B43B0A|nr:bifunctional riboflavin kinase/FAD synthetase [Streptococcus sp. sy010]TWT16765.1 bifunctional riboflavin kinase/FAD synthetase [Streptococcus sp. sy010]